MAKKRKSSILIYLEYFFFRILWWLLDVLPLKAAYAVVEVFFEIFFRFYGFFGGKRNKRAVQHILHAGVRKTYPEAWKLAQRNFAEFGRLLVEVVHMPKRYDPAKIRCVGDPESIRRVFNPDGVNENVIFVTAHYGNWELAGPAFVDKSRHELTSMMRPFSNPLIGEMILRSRAGRGGHHLVNKSLPGMRRLIQALRSGNNIALLIDQHTTSKEGVDTVFFGQPCRTHKTPALLHLSTGVPILPEITRRVPGGNFEFELVCGKLIEYQPTGDREHDIREITQLCTTSLEKLIAEKPEQWLWSHRRWLNINRSRRT